MVGRERTATRNNPNAGDLRAVHRTPCARARSCEVEPVQRRTRSAPSPLVGRGVMRRDNDGATCDGIALPPPPTPPHKGGGERTEYAAPAWFKHKRRWYRASAYLMNALL